jgi:hypothetical protein
MVATSLKIKKEKAVSELYPSMPLISAIIPVNKHSQDITVLLS